MLFKLIGGLLIMGGLWYWGNIKSKKFKLRPQQLRDLQVCLNQLSNEIFYLSTMMEDVLYKIAEKNKFIINKFFILTAENLKDAENNDIRTAWNKAVDECMPGTALEDEDENILKSFGALLGNTNKDGQIENINLTLQQLKNQEIKAEEEKKKYGNLYSRLGLLMGIAILITFM